MNYIVQINNFKGPFDLLLYFIRRDELDIYDIPISKITREFIEVIEQWKKMNMIIAGDFIVMASTLMRIKARLMIPRKEIDDDGDIIDPRKELIQQLIDYRRYRDAANMLGNLADERKNNIPRQFIQPVNDNDNKDLSILLTDSSLYDLAILFKKAIENKPVISQFELNREQISLEKQKEIVLKYFDGEGNLRFNTLIKQLETKMEIIVTFLAILELIREGACTIIQTSTFEEIQLVYLSIQS